MDSDWDVVSLTSNASYSTTPSLSYAAVVAGEVSDHHDTLSSTAESWDILSTASERWDVLSELHDRPSCDHVNSMNACPHAENTSTTETFRSPTYLEIAKRNLSGRGAVYKKAIRARKPVPRFYDTDTHLTDEQREVLSVCREGGKPWVKFNRFAPVFREENSEGSARYDFEDEVFAPMGKSMWMYN